MDLLHFGDTVVSRHRIPFAFFYRGAVSQPFPAIRHCGVSDCKPGGCAYPGRPVWEPISTYIDFPTIQLLGLKIPGMRAALLGMAAVTISVCIFFMKKTDPGRSMRALAQDKETASLYGINPGITALSAMGLAAILAGLAGVFYSVLYPLSPREGLNLTLKALFIVVAGGMGNLRGPAVAGLVLGFIESFAGFLFTYTSTDIMVYSLLVSYLAFKRGRRQ